MISLYYPIIDVESTGRNIRLYREKQGYSVTEVADYMGFLTPAAAYKWERGTTLPTVDHLFALSRLLKIPMDEIIVEKKIS